MKHSLKLVLATIVFVPTAHASTSVDPAFFDSLSNCSSYNSVQSFNPGKHGPAGSKNEDVRTVIKGRQGTDCLVEFHPQSAEAQGMHMKCQMKPDSIALLTSDEARRSAATGQASKEFEDRAQHLMQRDCQIAGMNEAMMQLQQGLQQFQQQMQQYQDSPEFKNMMNQLQQMNPGGGQ